MRAAQYRSYARLEEAMIRNTMPRVSAQDPTPLARLAADAVRRTVRRVAAVRPLTYTLAEVTHVAR